MPKRVAILWNILAVLTFCTWIWRGWDALTGTYICFVTILYYGENILARLKK